jgi:D-proline reductase (dithiol) PrdB
VCTLAHVFEAAGLATVVLSSIRPVAKQMAPPRALHCEFPLGRPLGKPQDAEFQHRVLSEAFALLERPRGPVLEDFPETLESADEEPLACALPPRYDPNLPAAVDEAKALRSAYDRARTARGRTSVGRAIAPDEIPDALGAFVRIAEGTPWNEAGLPSLPMAVAADIRAYYEELAVELADGPPGPWASERWFYDRTEAGRAILEARRAMKAAKAPFPMWFYMTPGARP